MEYEKAFQPTMENGASKHLITAEDPNLVIALDCLVSEKGVLVGQEEMLTEDTIYYLNPERKPLDFTVLKPNGEPLQTPQERLKRPTVLHNGVTRTISTVRVPRPYTVDTLPQ